MFTDFFERVKYSESQLYSIKPLDPNKTRLTGLLGVLAENLQTMLVDIGLGRLVQDKKLFRFQASKFERFCSKFTIQKLCETNQCKVKGTKLKQWFVRLGTQLLE